MWVSRMTIVTRLEELRLGQLSLLLLRMMMMMMMMLIMRRRVRMVMLS